MHVTNEFEFDINGVRRGFKFGTYAIHVISKETGIADIKEIFKRIELGDISVLTKFYYGGAVHYAKSKNPKLKDEELDFSEVNVLDWCDYLGQEEVSKMTLRLLESYQPKNFQPPTATGVNSQ
jgi:hypothetical protein